MGWGKMLCRPCFGVFPYQVPERHQCRHHAGGEKERNASDLFGHGRKKDRANDPHIPGSFGLSWHDPASARLWTDCHRISWNLLSVLLEDERKAIWWDHGGSGGLFCYRIGACDGTFGGGHLGVVLERDGPCLEARSSEEKDGVGDWRKGAGKA